MTTTRSSGALSIRPAMSHDADAITRIYNHYVRHTIVTFEEDDVTADEMWRRIEHVLAVSLPWLVAEEDERVVGYAYAAPWKPRVGYRFTAESTVYVAPDAVGRGIGRRLYAELLDLLKARPTHAVLGGIALPNAGSVALHERMGFQQVAHLREVGLKFGEWIDVGYWQKNL